MGLFRFGDQFFFSQKYLGSKSSGLNSGLITFERPGELRGIDLIAVHKTLLLILGVVLLFSF